MNVRRASSKLTLSLRVVGTRADGYHEIDALAVAVDPPHDVVEVAVAGTTSVAVVGPFAKGVPADESNLVARAAASLGVDARIHLHKQIPHGAGLGGGSSDAAAVLLLLRELCALPISDTQLASIAATLGADVAFCLGLHGGAATMRGIGEVIEPVAVPELHVVIATPFFGCATPAVYRAWDELGGPVAEAVDPGIEGLMPLANDLERAAWQVEPRLSAFRSAFAAAAQAPAFLAGSGSSYFALFDAAADALHAAQRCASANLEAHLFVAESL